MLDSVLQDFRHGLRLARSSPALVSSPTEPRVFLGAGALLAIVLLATAYIPARRAAGADPLAALRHE